MKPRHVAEWLQVPTASELQRKLDRAYWWLVFTATGFVLMTLLFLYVCSTCHLR